MALPRFLVESTSVVDKELFAREAKRSSAQQTARYEGEPWSSAAGLVYKDLNRYFNVLPYDHSRVKLRNGAYINANWIREPKLVDGSSRQMRTWIASQAPLAHTTGDFLSMLIDLQPAPRIIVQLTPLVERGMKKCSPYVPPQGDTWSFHTTAEAHRQIQISRTSSGTPSDAFAVNELAVDDGTSSRKVTHFELRGWPDFGVPSDPHGLMQLIQEVDRRHIRLSPDLSDPILVHCSAGVGRTGTLIALSSLLHQMPDIKDAVARNTWSQEQDPVAQIVDVIRSQRGMMVQTEQQLAFVRTAFKQAWQEGLSSQ